MVKNLFVINAGKYVGIYVRLKLIFIFLVIDSRYPKSINRVVQQPNVFNTGFFQSQNHKDDVILFLTIIIIRIY